MTAPRGPRRLSGDPPVLALTDAQVLAAMDPNGAPLKYGEIVAQLETALRHNGSELYRIADRVLQRMKRLGQVELVKGVGGGWRIPK